MVVLDDYCEPNDAFPLTAEADITPPDIGTREVRGFVERDDPGKPAAIHQQAAETGTSIRRSSAMHSLIIAAPTCAPR